VFPSFRTEIWTVFTDGICSKGIRNNIEVKQIKIQEFSEINGSFVGNVVGGAKSKGSSKL